MIRLIASLMLILAPAGSASAACPQGLAVYEGVEGIGELNFRGGSADATQQIALLYPDIEPVIGYLTTNPAFGRVEMVIPLKCPEGDVTGEELSACVVYSSALYAINHAGDVAALPESNEPAAEQILFPNLTTALWENPQFGENGPKAHPAEIYRLSGCQE